MRGDVPSEHVAKRHKPATVADVGKVATPRSAESSTVVASPLAEVMVERNKSPENVDNQSSKQNAFVVPQEHLSLKHSIRPLAPAGASFVMNRFKLDNRPTAFKIIPPLPTGLANVSLSLLPFGLRVGLVSFNHFGKWVASLFDSLSIVCFQYSKLELYCFSYEASCITLCMMPCR